MINAQNKNRDTDSNDWLTTYADMATLLMTFFVLLFSMSTLDPVKINNMLNGMADENAKPQVSLTTVKNEVKKLLKEEKLEDMIEVTKNARGVTMKIPGDFAFPSGTANVSGEIKALLIKMVPTMKKATYAIAVEGHTDNIPMRSAIFKSNWELSASRASAVVRYLISEGVDARKLRAIGFGDTQPKFPNDTRANQAKNRRVDITFLTVG